MQPDHAKINDENQSTDRHDARNRSLLDRRTTDGWQRLPFTAHAAIKSGAAATRQIRQTMS
jgi:hypothetical protein